MYIYIYIYINIYIYIYWILGGENLGYPQCLLPESSPENVCPE